MTFKIRRVKANVNPAAVRNARRVELKDELGIFKVIHDPLGEISIGNARYLNICRHTFAVIASLRPSNSRIGLRTAVS